jgi:CelD/BcsL family acetyltransferase involved in cellulose biosynthesis
MPMITSHIITSWSEIKHLEPEWNHLLAQSDADNIFLTWEWMESWRETCHSDTKPFFIVLTQANKTVAIAPFYIQPYRLFKCIKYSVLRFAGDQGIGSEYSNFIVEQTNCLSLKEQIWSTLLATSKAGYWDLIWYSNVASWSEGGKSLLTSLAKTKALHVKSRVMGFSNTSLSKLSQQVLPSLSKSLRTNIKQTQGYLSRQGEWEVSFCEDPAILEQTLNRLFELHNQRWEKAGLKGSFERRPEMAAFYQHFALRALQRGWLRLAQLECNGIIQAMQIGYVYQGKFLALQEGFNADFQNGVGQVLRYHVFLDCLEKNLTDYDFLGVHTNHKRRWLAEKREGKHLLIWPNKIKNVFFNIMTIWPTGKYFKPE